MNKVSFSLFRSTLECAEKGAAIKSGYLGRDDKLIWLRNVRKELPDILRNSDFAKCDILAKMFPEVHATACENEAEVKKGIAQMERMVEYVLQNGIKILPGCTWATRVDEETVVTGMIDFVAEEPNGARTAVMLDMLHKPVSSKQARKECNKLHFNLQLVLAANAHAIEGVTKYAVWHFNGKDDRQGNFAEFKNTANIVEFDFGDNPEAYLGRAVELYREANHKTCCDCAYCSVCKDYAAVPDSDSDGEVTGPKAKIRLTESQRKVVDFRDGNLAVLAVPGSGKTNTLACRTAAIIHDGSAKPGEILFLTFTRKAAGELADRICGMLPADSEQPEVNTINGWCFNVLKDNSRIIGKVKLAEDPVRRSLLLKAVNELAEQGVRVKDINYSYMLGEFGALKSLDRYVEFFASAGEERFKECYPKVDVEGIRAVAERLGSIMEKDGYIRFDDQLSRCYQLLTEHPAVLRELAAAYRFVMVDEAQDLNDIQYRIVSLVADAGHGNLCMVGDDDQSIYDFRGGSNEFLLDFAKRTGTVNVFMEDSFRIVPPVAELANEVIARNSVRIGKMIKAGREGSNKPFMMQDANDTEIADFIRRLAKKYGGRNVAVLARTNARLIKLAAVLEECGVAASSPKDYLIDDRIVNMIQDMLCFIMDNDAKAFTRLFNHFTGGIDVTAKNGETYYEALVREKLIVPVDGVENRRKYLAGKDIEPLVRSFGMTVFRCRQALESAVTAEDVLRGFFSVMFDEGTDNENEVLEFLADKFREAGVDTPAALKNHISSLRIFGDMTRMPYIYPGDTVSLLTAHDAKGKEFDCVVILDADEFGCYSDKPEAEEARRLLYVAITRAREALAITTSGGAMEADLIAEIAPYCNLRKKKEGENAECSRQKSGMEKSAI